MDVPYSACNCATNFGTKQIKEFIVVNCFVVVCFVFLFFLTIKSNLGLRKCILYEKVVFWF